MNEDEILSFDYRSPTKRRASDYEDFEEWYENLPRKDYNYFQYAEPKKKSAIPVWCEVGTKISGVKPAGKKADTFGIVSNVQRANYRVNVKWSNGREIGYDIDYLNNLIEQDSIEILEIM